MQAKLEIIERLIRQQGVQVTDGLQRVSDQILIAMGRNILTAVPQMNANGPERFAQERYLASQRSNIFPLVNNSATMRNKFSVPDLYQDQFQPCSCRPKSKCATFRKGNIGFDALSQSSHRDDCPSRHSGWRLWYYSFTVCLHPLLDKVVEFTLGAATGPGGWTIMPPLKVNNIVKRSESPIFQAFQRFPKLCLIESASRNDHRIYRRSQRSDQKRFRAGWEDARYVWSPETGRHLEDIEFLLRKETSCGRFSGSDVAENGLTILFVSLLILFVA